MIEVKTCQSKEQVILKGRADLIEYLSQCKSRDEKVLLCLSGGSALDLLNDFNYDVLGSHVTITVLDERFSIDPAINNMTQIEERGFLDKAKKQGCEVIDTKVRLGENIDDFTSRFDVALGEWIKNNEGGQVVATAGMGPDKHTAGIIPGSEHFKELFLGQNNRLVVGYIAANQPEDRNRRVTTTFEFLKQIAFAVLIVMGEDKRPALSSLMAENGSLEVAPVRVWREVRGNVMMFTNL